MAEALTPLIPTPDRRRSALPTTQSDLTILPGSYIMNMPTREGRSAIVIFPPSDESMGDIKNMLGEDETGESGYAFCSLQRVILTGKGGGCRLVAKEC